MHSSSEWLSILLSPMNLVHLSLVGWDWTESNLNCISQNCPLLSSLHLSRLQHSDLDSSLKNLFHSCTFLSRISLVIDSLKTISLSAWTYIFYLQKLKSLSLSIENSNDMKLFLESVFVDLIRNNRKLDYFEFGPLTHMFCFPSCSFTIQWKTVSSHLYCTGSLPKSLSNPIVSSFCLSSTQSLTDQGESMKFPYDRPCFISSLTYPFIVNPNS